MTLQIPKTAHERLNASAVLLTVAMCSWLFAHLLTDYDLWGHLKFGLDYIACGRLPATDSYSYIAARQTWFSHSWLFELLTAAAYLAAGVTGLALLKCALATGVCVLLLVHLLRSGAPPLASCALVLSAALGLAHYLMPLRPQLATYLLFTSELIVLRTAARGNAKALFLLPPMFALWCNLHGGFAAGILMLFLWSALRLAEIALADKRAQEQVPTQESRHQQVIMATAVALSVVATAINPYGLRLWVFLVTTLGLPRPEIIEWLPLKLTGIEGVFYFCVLLFAAAPMLFCLLRRQPPALTDGGLVLAALCLPLLAARHLPLFVITALVCATCPLQRWQQSLTLKEQQPSRRQSMAANLAATAMFVAAGAFLALIPAQLTRISVGRDMPQAAVEFLKAHHAKGHLTVHFDWGEYCIYHLFPAMQVSIDGRREQVYSPAQQHLVIDFMYGLDDHWADLIRLYPTDAVLVPKNFPVYARMKRLPGWTEVYTDRLCGLFVQAGSAAHRQLAGDTQLDQKRASAWPSDAPLAFP